MMSLEVKWYDAAHTILIATIAKDTTWEEYHKSVDYIISEAHQANRRVDVIFHDEVGMPVGNPMPHLKQGISKMGKEPNIGYYVIAGSRGSSGFVRAMIEIVLKVAMKGAPAGQGNGAFARTLKDGIAIIERDRAKVKVTA
jgi:hypothetical protein